MGQLFIILKFLDFWGAQTGGSLDFFLRHKLPIPVITSQLCFELVTCLESGDL